MHTSGEWRVFAAEQPGIEAPGFSIVIYGSQGEECGIKGHTPSEARANAALIAAAPDLLAALREIAEDAGFGVQHRMRAVARAAIAKAELSPDPSPGIS